MYGLIRMGGPGYGEVIIQPSFLEWLAVAYPGQDPSGLAATDTDADGLQAIFEYLYETNPHQFNTRAEVPLQVRMAGGHLEIEVVTRESYAGVLLGLAKSADFSGWSDANGDFDHQVQSLGGGRVRHVFRSIQPNNSTAGGQFFRLAAIETPITP